MIALTDENGVKADVQSSTQTGRSWTRSARSAAKFAAKRNEHPRMEEAVRAIKRCWRGEPLGLTIRGVCLQLFSPCGVIIPLG